MYTPSLRVKENGVPILSKAEIDVIGERFVRDFQPDVLAHPAPVDIEGFIEFYLGMTPDYQYLSHNGVYLGMTVFNDTNKVPVYDPVNHRADYISAKARKQRWQSSTVESILKNEKYKGAALLQKCFTVDFLTKKRKVNEGEVPQYYVEHSHEPIISPEEFDKVQAEFERRKQLGRQYSGKSIFASRIVCADCGSFFGPKVWNSNSKYRKVIWQCNGKFRGEKKCSTPHLDERTIKDGFVAAFNQLLGDKERILDDCRLMQATLTDCEGIDSQIAELEQEIEVVTELTKRCIAENAQAALSQVEYNTRYNGLVQRYNVATANLESLQKTKADREVRADTIGEFIFRVQELDALTEFDEKLWLATIETVTIHTDGRMTFHFQCGVEIAL